MRTVKALALASCLTFASRMVYAQATQISAPDGDYLLRVWGGYGLARTGGIIPRRTGRQWQTWRATDVRCHLDVALPIADTLPPLPSP